jgi:hypothetical protein
MVDEIQRERRRFLGTAVMTIAAARLGMTQFAVAQSSRTRSADQPSNKPRAGGSFGSLKQVDAGVPERWLRRGRPRQWPGGHPPARLALRHS